MVEEILLEDGTPVAFHELDSCWCLLLQNCTAENMVNYSVLATKENAHSNSCHLRKKP